LKPQQKTEYKNRVSRKQNRAIGKEAVGGLKKPALGPVARKELRTWGQRGKVPINGGGTHSSRKPHDGTDREARSVRRTLKIASPESFKFEKMSPKKTPGPKNKTIDTPGKKRLYKLLEKRSKGVEANSEETKPLRSNIPNEAMKNQILKN